MLSVLTYPPILSNPPILSKVWNLICYFHVNPVTPRKKYHFKLKRNQLKISYLYHPSCQGSSKCGLGILAHGACPGLYNTASLPLDFCHWSLSPPNPSLMSLVLMLASKHKVQRGHLQPFSLSHKFLWFHWLTCSQSLPPPPSATSKLSWRPRASGAVLCYSLVSNLDMRPALLYFCWCCTMMTQRNSGNGKWGGDILALGFTSLYLRGSAHWQDNESLSINPQQYKP